MRLGRAQPDLELGEFVVCDQFVDRTCGRADTFYDGPETTHVSAADPYCPDLRGCSSSRARARHPGRGRRHGRRRPGPALLHPRRVALVPDDGLDVINMTAYPEATSPASSSSATRTSRWSPTTTSASRAPSRSRTRRRHARVPGEQRAAPRALFAAIPRIGPQPEDVCATALARSDSRVRRRL